MADTADSPQPAKSGGWTQFLFRTAGEETRGIPKKGDLLWCFDPFWQGASCGRPWPGEKHPSFGRGLAVPWDFPLVDSVPPSAAEPVAARDCQVDTHPASGSAGSLDRDNSTWDHSSCGHCILCIFGKVGRIAKLCWDWLQGHHCWWVSLYQTFGCTHSSPTDCVFGSATHHDLFWQTGEEKCSGASSAVPKLGSISWNGGDFPAKILWRKAGEAATWSPARTRAWGLFVQGHWDSSEDSGGLKGVIASSKAEDFPPEVWVFIGHGWTETHGSRNVSSAKACFWLLGIEAGADIRDEACLTPGDADKAAVMCRVCHWDCQQQR